MNSSFFSRHTNLLLGIGVVFSALLSLLYAHHQIITPDQGQMLTNGYNGAHQGIWQPFGNAASAVSNVPGYLSGLLVGLPLLLWDNPWSPMLFLILLRLTSFFLFDAVLKQVVDAPVRVLFMVLYLLNPWFQYDNLIYNPAYLCFFMAVHCWTAFQLREKTSFIYSLLHVLAIGGAMQLHYSWPVLAVISCYLLYRRMALPHWGGVMTAFILIGASLIPYFQELGSNDSIHQETDRYIGYGAVHVYPVLKAVFYWLRFGSTLFSNRIITDASFDWLTSLSWLQMCVQFLWQGILFLCGAATVVLSAKINWQLWKEAKTLLLRGQPIENNKIWCLLFACSTVLAIIVSAMLSPITFSYWHLIITLPIALFPLCLFADRGQLPKNISLQTFTLGITAYFLVVNLISAHDSNKFHHSRDYQQQVMQDFIQH